MHVTIFLDCLFYGKVLLFEQRFSPVDDEELIVLTFFLMT